MPSTSPPLPHHYTPASATSSHYAATTAHSWGRFGFHQQQQQPAAMYDTTSDLYLQQDYASSDHITRPPSFTFSSPVQQTVPPTTRYSSPMSRHPAWAYSGYTQFHSAYSSADARTSSLEPSIAHKVWLLECKHCLTFLTNRGMKVRAVRWHALRPVIKGPFFSPGSFASSPARRTVLYRRASRQLFSLCCKAAIDRIPAK